MAPAAASAAMSDTLRAPFPWFGGKSRAAALIWSRLGNVPNYVEPFAGSLAVLLARPHPPNIETVNDRDAYLSNFWRAVQADPDGVAEWADWPVSEPDLHARHLWLITTGAERVERLMTAPDYYDVKVAGWWVWGLCQWIGSGWCGPAGQKANGQPKAKLPHLGDAGMGVHRQLPHLRNAGKGVHRKRLRLDGRGKMGEPNRAHLVEYMHALSERLRRVRVCCGDWTRVMGPTVTEKNGLTGILLDPPYDSAAGRDSDLYAVETDVSAAVREWAIANGDNPQLRIALCGYDGEHVMPDTWECVAWKAVGGYGSLSNGQGRDNAVRERIWFSPACLKPAHLRQMELL